MGRLLALATTLIVARSLGVAEFGVFAALSGVALVVSEGADLGLQPTAARELVAGTRPLAAFVRAKLLLTAIVFAATLLVAPLWPLLAALVAYYALAGWSEFLGVALRARGKPLREAVSILCLRAAALLGAALALLLGAGILGIAAALAAGMLVPLAVGALLLRGTAPARLAPEPSLGSLLRAAFPLGLTGGLALVSLRLEVVALGLLRDAADAGLYASALRVVESLLLVPGAIAAGAMPALTREALRGEGPVRARTARSAALLAVPAAAGLAFVAPGAIRLLFGAAFGGATAPLRVLAFALPPLFMSAVLLYALTAAGRAAWLPLLVGLRVALAGALALLLIPRYGALGAAAGFLAAEIVLLFLLARACALARFTVPVFAPLALAAGLCVPMIAVLLLVRGGLLASIALGTLSYAATLLAAWRLRSRRLTG